MDDDFGPFELKIKDRFLITDKDVIEALNLIEVVSREKDELIYKINSLMEHKHESGRIVEKYMDQFSEGCPEKWGIIRVDDKYFGAKLKDGVSQKDFLKIVEDEKDL